MVQGINAVATCTPVHKRTIILTHKLLSLFHNLALKRPVKGETNIATIPAFVQVMSFLGPQVLFLERKEAKTKNVFFQSHPFSIEINYLIGKKVIFDKASRKHFLQNSNQFISSTSNRYSP